jgi:regulator of protease activity HflC (stomatin/prohibitin superfamily)
MPVWGWILLVLVVLVLAGGIAALSLFQRVRVFEFERALKYRAGRFVGVLGPGQHWLFRPSVDIRKLDVRPRFVSVPGQEVLSSDGVSLRTSLAAEYEIATPPGRSTRSRAFRKRST